MAPEPIWYAGIGSMMNPDSIVQRGLAPLESCPCKCVDFERRFWGKYGMAEVREKAGHEFHAVLHRITARDLQILDATERGYYRVDVVCYRYDGSRVVATAYQFDEARLMLNAHTPPSERYLNLLITGMEHFGCDARAIEDMRRTPHQGLGTR